MVISKCSNLVCRKRQVQTRFNVFLSPFVACKAVQFLSVYTNVWSTSPTVIVFHGRIPWIFDYVSAHMIATASKSTTAKSFVDSCLLCTTPKYVNDCRLTPRWPWILCSAVRYLFVTQCCHPILAGRGRGISILIRKEHTIISKNFVRLLQSFFFCSNRPRSMYY